MSIDFCYFLTFYCFCGIIFLSAHPLYYGHSRRNAYMATGNGVKRLPLRGTFPGLDNLLACVNLVMAASEARLYPKIKNDGQVSVEVKAPRTRTPLLTFCLRFASPEHAATFLSLAQLRANNEARYCFKSDDNCSIVAVPTSDYKEFCQIFNLDIPCKHAVHSTALELRTFTAGLDIILNVLSSLINLKLNGAFVYTAKASCSVDSRLLTIEVTHSETTIFSVTFSRQLKELDADAVHIATILNGAFSQRAPVLLSSSSDCEMEIIIGTPSRKKQQDLLSAILIAVNASKS